MGAVAREPQNSRSRGRNNETEVLGQISRQHSISSRRRDASNVDTSVDTEVADARSARARSRTQRNEDGFSNVVSRTSSRRNPLPESLERGHRSSARARNSLGQHTRRSSRGALSSRSQEFQEDENSEEDVTAGRSRRSTRRTSSRVLEEKGDDESDEELPESEQNVEMSDAESQYSDDNNESSSSVGSEFEGQKLPPSAPK